MLYLLMWDVDSEETIFEDLMDGTGMENAGLARIC